MPKGIIKIKKDQSGQTFVEILISLGLFSGMSLAIISLFVFSSQAIKVSFDKLDKRGAVRQTIDSATAYVKANMSIAPGVYRLDTTTGKLESFDDPSTPGVVEPAILPCVVVGNIGRAATPTDALLTSAPAVGECVAPVNSGINDQSGKTVTAYVRVAGGAPMSLTRVVDNWEGLVFEQSNWSAGSGQGFWQSGGTSKYESGTNVNVDPATGDLKLVGGTTFKTPPDKSADCLIHDQYSSDANIGNSVDNLSIATNSLGHILTSWLWHGSTEVAGENFEQLMGIIRDQFPINGCSSDIPYEGEEGRRYPKHINQSKPAPGAVSREYNVGIKADSYGGKKDDQGDFLLGAIAELDDISSGACVNAGDPDFVRNLIKGKLGENGKKNQFKPLSSGVKNPSSVCPWGIWFDAFDGGEYPKRRNWVPDKLLNSADHSQHGTTPIQLSDGTAIFAIRQDQAIQIKKVNRDSSSPQGENLSELAQFKGLVEPPRIVPLPEIRLNGNTYNNLFAAVLLVPRVDPDATPPRVFNTFVIGVYDPSPANDIFVMKCYVEEISNTQADSINGMSLAVTGNSAENLKFVLARSNEVAAATSSAVRVHEISLLPDLANPTFPHFEDEPDIGNRACGDRRYFNPEHFSEYLVASPSSPNDVMTNVRVNFVEPTNLVNGKPTYTVSFGYLTDGAGKSLCRIDLCPELRSLDYAVAYVTNQFGSCDSAIAGGCSGHSKLKKNRCMASPQCIRVVARAKGLQVMDMDNDLGNNLYFTYSRGHSEGATGTGIPSKVFSVNYKIVQINNFMDIISSGFDLGREDAKVQSTSIRGSTTGAVTISIIACSTNDRTIAGNSNNPNRHDPIRVRCSNPSVVNVLGSNFHTSTTYTGVEIPIRGRYVWYELRLVAEEGTQVNIGNISTNYSF